MSDTDALASPADETDDWPARAASTVVGYVDTVRSATTGKALVISRAAVYLLAAALIAMVVLVLALIMLTRLVVSLTGNYLDFVEPGETWFAYLLLGAIFLLIGIVAWRRKGA